MSDLVRVDTPTSEDPTNPGKRTEHSLVVLERVRSMHTQLERTKRDLNKRIDSLQALQRSQSVATAQNFADHAARLASLDERVEEAVQKSNDALDALERRTTELVESYEREAAKLRGLLDKHREDAHSV